MITFFSSIEANADIKASKNVKAVGFDDIFTRKVKHFGPALTGKWFMQQMYDTKRHLKELADGKRHRFSKARESPSN